MTIDEIMNNTGDIIQALLAVEGVGTFPSYIQKTVNHIFNQPSGLPCPECDGECVQRWIQLDYDPEIDDLDGVAVKQVLEGFEFEKDCETCHGTGRRTLLQALELLEKGKMVELADDQSLPEGAGICMDCLDSYKMLEANFKKVIPNKGEGKR